MSQNECNHDCGNCNLNCSEKKESFLEKPHPMSSIKNVIGVVSGKGGVGKSSITALLSVLSQNLGKNTAILDADILGPSIPKMFGLSGTLYQTEQGIFPKFTKKGTQVVSTSFLLQNETDPVIWRGPVLAGLVTQFWKDVIWNQVDNMFVDMPPGTGDVPLTVFQSLPLKGIVIVTSCQELVGVIVEKAIKMANELNIPILGIVENMSYFTCPNCKEKHYIFGESKVDEIAKKYNIDTVIKLPINPELPTLCDKGLIENYNSLELKPILDKLK